MTYWEYKFEINEQGIKLTDKADPNETYMVCIDKTPLNVGDTFTLEFDEHNRMFFKKDGPVQTQLNFGF